MIESPVPGKNAGVTEIIGQSLPMRAAAAHRDQEDDSADDRDGQRTKATETIGKESEHLLSIVRDVFGGLVFPRWD
jgi:hypothetical protein